MPHSLPSIFLGTSHLRPKDKCYPLLTSSATEQKKASVSLLYLSPLPLSSSSALPPPHRHRHYHHFHHWWYLCAICMCQPRIQGLYGNEVVQFSQLLLECFVSEMKVYPVGKAINSDSKEGMWWHRVWVQQPGSRDLPLQPSGTMVECWLICAWLLGPYFSLIHVAYPYSSLLIFGCFSFWIWYFCQIIVNFCSHLARLIIMSYKQREILGSESLL